MSARITIRLEHLGRTAQIFMKFDVYNFPNIFYRKSDFFKNKNLTGKPGTLQEDMYDNT